MCSFIDLLFELLKIPVTINNQKVFKRVIFCVSKQITYMSVFIIGVYLYSVQYMCKNAHVFDRIFLNHVQKYTYTELS